MPRDPFKLSPEDAFTGYSGYGNLGITNPLTVIPQKLKEANAKLVAIQKKIAQIKDPQVRSSLNKNFESLVTKGRGFAARFKKIQSLIQAGAKVIQSAAKRIKTAFGLKGLGILPAIPIGLLLVILAGITALLVSINALDANASRQLEKEKLSMQKTAIEKGYTPEQVTSLVKAQTPAPQKGLIERTLQPIINLAILGLGAYLTVQLVPKILDMASEKHG